MTQLPYLSPGAPPGFQNCKSGLLVAGIFLIIFGAIAGCLVVSLPLTLMVSSTIGPATLPTGASHFSFQTRNFAAAIGLYAMISIGLIWTGIGSIQARRWVRPVVICIGTITILIGGSSALAMLAIVPASLSQARATSMPAGGVSPAMLLQGMIIGFGFVLLAVIGIPAVYVWYFSRQRVLRTLQLYDPHRRWTDDCPLPVLGVSIACAMVAAMAFTSTVHSFLFVFGTFLTGAMVPIVALFIVAVMGIAAWLNYRQRLAGWWLSLLVLIVFAASTAVSGLKFDSATFVGMMGLPPDQAELVEASATQQPAAYLITAILFGSLGLVYLLWVRKYFTSSKNGRSESAVETQ